MERKPINYTYFNPNNSVFKAFRSDRERVTVYFCSNCENCDAYKLGKCIMLGGLFGRHCPYGSMIRDEGMTKASKSCGKLISEYNAKYKDVAYKLKELDHIAMIGNYVFLPLAYIASSQYPIRDHSFFTQYDSGYVLLEKEKLTSEFVKELFLYRPHAYFGGEITSYQKEKLPTFALQLKKRLPDLYEEVKSIFPQIEDYIKTINYVGKKAKVKTLLPGTVKISANYWDWDGTTLTANVKDVLLFPSQNGFTDEVLSFQPDNDVYVEITNNDTVTDKTIFQND